MEIEKCKCGAEPRIRSSGGFTWLECKKKCGMKTGFYLETETTTLARSNAIKDWNAMVKKK